nr:sodium channel protein Nach [Helicoverpa armigera]
MSYTLATLLYKRFEEMPTRVTIESQFEPVVNLPYPAITICTPNQMTLTSLKDLKRSLVDGNLTIDLEATMPLLLGFHEIVNNPDLTVLRHLEELFEANRYTIPEVMGTLPQSCDRFLKRCFLEGVLYANCEDLFQPILTGHGYCCAFNSLYMFNGKRNIAKHNFENRTVKHAGVTHALVAVTDYEVDDAVPGTLLNAGAIRVMYTDWTEFPSDDETAIVDTRGESYHFLSATYTYCSDEVQSLPVWSRKCYFEDERFLPFFRNYHNSNCDHMCYVVAVKRACGCFPEFLPNVRADDVCKITKIPCIIQVKQDMQSWLFDDYCECPRDCVSRKYRAEITVGNFKALKEVLKNP